MLKLPLRTDTIYDKNGQRKLHCYKLKIFQSLSEFASEIRNEFTNENRKFLANGSSVINVAFCGNLDLRQYMIISNRLEVVHF